MLGKDNVDLLGRKAVVPVMAHALANEIDLGTIQELFLLFEDSHGHSRNDVFWG